MRISDWLTARPIAHRGLHDQARGILENTASAVNAAISAGYAIEVDLQISADGEAVVHHDPVLGRVTDGAGALSQMTAAELKRIRYRGTDDRIMTLGELLELVGGRVMLFLELKSHFDEDYRLVDRTVRVVEGYKGPLATMSFDAKFLRVLRHVTPHLPRGLICKRHFPEPEWDALTMLQKLTWPHLIHAPRTRPHFVAYCVDDLPTVATRLARHVFRLPLLAWTVRSQKQRKRAEQFADQMIFEGFQP